MFDIFGNLRQCGSEITACRSEQQLDALRNFIYDIRVVVIHHIAITQLCRTKCLFLGELQLLFLSDPFSDYGSGSMPNRRAVVDQLRSYQ